MRSNASRLVMALGAALALWAGAQTVGSIRADFQNDVSPTRGYTGTADVSITIQDEQQQGQETSNYHRQTELHADGFPVRQSSLMHFQLDGGQIPTGSIITGANLEFSITNESYTGFSVYEVLRPWDEGQATYLKATDNQSWAVPGAAGVGVDRSAVPFARFGHFDAGAVAVIGVTDAGVDLVRKWLTGAEPNNGLIVQDYDSWDKMSWYSVEGAQAPVLVVSYGTTSARIKATDDTMIGYEPRTSFDGWGLAFSGRPAGLTSSLIRFDVRAIPPGVKVTSAGIAFTVNRLAASTTALPVDIYPALRPWTEGANWLTYDGSNIWSQSGAQAAGFDYGLKAGSFPPTCTMPEGSCLVSFSPELIGRMQAWVDTPANNDGLFLQNYLNNDDLQLMDSEWPAKSSRPKLSVQFTWDAGSPPGLYPAYAEVYAGEQVAMKAFGGAGAYEFSVNGISGATIDQSGNYTAGTFAGQDQVLVQDQGGAGATASATIVVLGNSSTVDGGSPITISFPDPPPLVPPQGNFAVTAHISSRASSSVYGLMLEVSGEALNPEGATLLGVGRLPGTVDAGFQLPRMDPGVTLQVSITGALNAVPSDSPSVTGTVKSGPIVVAKATTPVLMDVPAPISTGCGCGSASGGLSVVLLAGILQMVARRRASRSGG